MPRCAQERARQGGLDGVLVVDKPAGPTSHDVVARVRRACGTPRVGHTGTLDPFATGVLPVVLGRATRLAQFLAAGPKDYVAGVRLGVTTNTHDATGTPTGGDPSRLPSREEVEAALAAFRGRFEQRPPEFSAKKVRGVRAYALAREDRPVELAPVPVEVFALALDAWSGGERLTLRVSCGAGFYVRALARDLGERLGCGAHLVSLRRTRSGEFGERDAIGLAVIEHDLTAARAGLMRLDGLLAWMSTAHLGADAVARVAHGAAVTERDVERWSGPGTASGGPPPPGDEGTHVRLLGPDGALLAVARAAPGARGGPVLHPRVVLV